MKRLDTLNLQALWGWGRGEQDILAAGKGGTVWDGQDYTWCCVISGRASGARISQNIAGWLWDLGGAGTMEKKMTWWSKCWWLSAGGWWCLVCSVTRHSDQDGLREGEERERVEIEALGRWESRREGWMECRQELPRWEVSFIVSVWCWGQPHSRNYVPRVLWKPFPSSPGSALTYTSTSMIHFTPAVFVLGLTWADTAN